MPELTTDLPSELQPTGDTASPSAPTEAAVPTETTQTLPDSFSYENLQPAADTSFDPADWENFKSIAAELKLSPQQIEKLVAFEAQCAQRKTQAAANEQRQQIADWATQTKAHYGADLEQEIAFALRGANTFGGPELRALLEETGLGNHPVIIRTFSGIGRALSEDVCSGGKPSAPQDKTFAEALYGKQN